MFQKIPNPSGPFSGARFPGFGALFRNLRCSLFYIFARPVHLRMCSLQRGIYMRKQNYMRKIWTDEHTRTSVNSTLVSFIAHLSTLLIVMAYSSVPFLLQVHS